MPIPDDLDARIRFDAERQIMEVDFSGLHFDDSHTVNAVYDRIEERIAETGEEKWFFLVNLHDMRTDPTAWIAYHRRGKALNLSHSQGSVRFDPSDVTRRQILRAANTEAFDPNLFADRESALARIAELPSQRRPRIQHDPNYTLHDFVRRIHFDHDSGVMEADFSHFSFHHSRDVNDFYDYIEEQIAASGRKWFFLVDLNGCQIMPAAWVRYAMRGKRLNEGGSLGSVRYAAGSETEADIRMRAETQGFRPNIRNTREEAIERLNELRDEVLHLDKTAGG